MSLSAFFYPKSVHLHQNFPSKITSLSFIFFFWCPLLCGCSPDIEYSVLSFSLFLPFCSQFSLSPFPFNLMDIYIPYTAPEFVMRWEKQGFLWKGSGKAERSVFIVSFCFSSNLYQKKWCQKNPNSRLVYWKRGLAVSLHNHLLVVKMENASLEDLSEVFQKWPSTEGSLILLLLWNPQVRSYLSVCPNFWIYFSPILWFSSYHTCLFLWPLLLSFDHYTQTNLF